MAKKSTAKRQKTSGKKTKKYDKSNRTRCSPSDVAELIKELGDTNGMCKGDRVWCFGTPLRQKYEQTNNDGASGLLQHQGQHHEDHIRDNKAGCN
ncbi:hypothetical protein PIB30_014858 [Stylosanthes scabra]|uniref:Uncharacterized protein n=1 Tax=Stylosanthes scabra TaxID=79078 RepID=A0ABU6S764_9FABA|nr:hypothetical protein [Stylosanthes scabra]